MKKPNTDGKTPQENPAAGLTRDPVALRTKTAAPAQDAPPAPASRREGVPIIGILAVVVGIGAIGGYFLMVGGKDKGLPQAGARTEPDSASAGSQAVDPVKPLPVAEGVSATEVQGRIASQAELESQKPVVTSSPSPQTTDKASPPAEVSSPPPSQEPVATAAAFAELDAHLGDMLLAARVEPVPAERLAIIARLGIQATSARTAARTGDYRRAVSEMRPVLGEASRLALAGRRQAWDAEVEKLSLGEAAVYLGKDWESTEELWKLAESLVGLGEGRQALALADQAVAQLPRLRDQLIARFREAAGEAVRGADVPLAVQLYLKLHQISPEDSVALDYLHAHRFKAGEAFRSPTGLAYVFVPPGAFLQGSPQDEAGRDRDETQRQVRITRGFHLLVTEVTQAQWDLVYGSGAAERKLLASGSQPVGPEFPMHSITFAEAVDFCRRLSETEGVPHRLPTEAEWEYAARAATTSAYANGRGDLRPDEARFDDPAVPLEAPAPAGTNGPPNSWGLRDVHGNVYEWTADWSAPYAPGPQVDPKGPAEDAVGRVDLAMKVIRGGSWRDSARMARSANRAEQSPVVGENYLGFRVLREINRFTP